VVARAAGVDVCGCSEEALAVLDLDHVRVRELPVRVTGDDLEEVTISTDAGELPKLGPGQLLLRHLVSAIEPPYFAVPPRYHATAIVDNRGRVMARWRPMKPAKAMTIRLSADQAEQLETVATVDNQPVSEVIRAAIAEHIENRRRDAKFKDGLKDRIARAQELLGED